MSKNKTIFDFWDFDYPPRMNQIKALKWIEKEVLENGTKNLLLELPVGSGKSNIALVVSRWVRSIHDQLLDEPKEERAAYIITPQKILQKQYENSFDSDDWKVASLYGKGNYACSPKQTTCDVGGTTKPRCPNCPHREAKLRAAETENVIFNYALALNAFVYTWKTFPTRDLIVFDECHSIEDHLVAFDALKITDRRCKRYGWKFQSHKTLKDGFNWVESYYVKQVKKKVAQLQVEVEPLIENSDNLSKQDAKLIREFNGLVEHLDLIEDIITNGLEYAAENYVLVNSITEIEFKRLSAAYSFNKILEKHSTRKLFMSSTILDKSGFCEDVGLDPEETAMLSLKSEFPIENRPIYYKPIMRMNKDWNTDKNIQKRKETIKFLIGKLREHGNESGIIHTGNFAIARWLVDELSGNIPHTIFHHNPDSGMNREDSINLFIDHDRPGILISPSSTEGLDLKDDLGRFAIFMKVPFGNLGDQWIKRKMELSGKWYRRRALINIIQGGGRVVRSETDTGVVYILDESFGFLFKQSVGMIPNWWKESYKKC